MAVYGYGAHGLRFSFRNGGRLHTKLNTFSRDPVEEVLRAEYILAHPVLAPEATFLWPPREVTTVITDIHWSLQVPPRHWIRVMAGLLPSDLSLYLFHSFFILCYAHWHANSSFRFSFRTPNIFRESLCRHHCGINKAAPQLMWTYIIATETFSKGIQKRLWQKKFTLALLSYDFMLLCSTYLTSWHERYTWMNL